MSLNIKLTNQVVISDGLQYLTKQIHQKMKKLNQIIQCFSKTTDNQTNQHQKVLSQMCQNRLK